MKNVLRPFEWKGKLIYPLNSAVSTCAGCTFNSNGTPTDCGLVRAQAITLFGNSTTGCLGKIWAEGPAAQAQYILERLTS